MKKIFWVSMFLVIISLSGFASCNGRIRINADSDRYLIYVDHKLCDPAQDERKSIIVKSGSHNNPLWL